MWWSNVVSRSWFWYWGCLLRDRSTDWVDERSLSQLTVVRLSKCSWPFDDWCEFLLNWIWICFVYLNLFLNLLSLNSPHHHTQAYLPFSFDLPPSRSQLSHPLEFKVTAELTDGNNASQAAHTWTNHQSTHGFHPARLCSWGLNHVTKMRKRTRRRGLPRRLIHRGTWQYV